MKNIELKIKVNDFEDIEKSLKVLGAKFYGILNQKDTYFNCDNGKLKAREINNKNFELIFYQRPNRMINNLSDYIILPITNQNQFKQLKIILALSVGTKVVVSKSRRLWLYKNTRIHLDDVKKLGKFLELETVLGKILRAKGEKEYLKIFSLLKLSKFKKLSKSYSDLLIKKS